MFSHTIRPFSQENAESVIVRKPGTSTGLRKPFTDRSVNGATPVSVGKKPTYQKKEPVKVEKFYIKADKSAKILKKHENKEDLYCEDLLFSYKEPKDTFEDIWPSYQRPSQTELINIMRDYANCRNLPTPPPEIETIEEMDPMILRLPEPLFSKPIEYSVPRFELDESFEVPLPEFTDFDI